MPRESAPHPPGAVVESLRALLRAVHTLRTYPRDNEISRRDLSQLVPMLMAVGPFQVDVRADGFQRDGVALLDPGVDRGGIVPSLYRDGVRQLDFRRGLTPPEIEALVVALAERIHPDDLSEDYVTRLWEADLKHVGVVAVDPYLAVDIEEDVLEGKAKPELDPDGLPAHAREEVPPPPPEAFRIGENDALRIAREVAQSHRTPPWVRFIEVLVETLLSPVGMRRAEELVLVVEALFQALVTGERFGDAGRLLRRLRDSVPATALPQLFEAIRRMAGPARLAPVGEALAAGRGNREELEALLLLLAPAVVPTSLDFLLAAPADEVREFHAQLLVKIGKPALDPIVARLSETEDAARLSLVGVLGRLRDPRAVEALGAELRSAPPALRREIVRALGSIPGVESTRLLLQIGVGDADVGCRILALRCLGEKADQLGQDQLLSRIRLRDGSIGKEERDLLFLALGRVGDEQVLPFLAKFLKRSWIPGRWSREDAQRAAGALARMRSPKARELLDRLSESRGDLGEICSMALLDAGRRRT